MFQKRQAWKLGNRLSTKTTPEIVNFDVAGLLGGIIHEDRKPGGADFTKETAAESLGVGIKGNTHLGFLGDEFERKTVKSLCFPIYSILLALGNPTVHYFR